VGLGAHAFLAKGCEVHELVNAVRGARACRVSHGAKTIPRASPHAATTTDPAAPTEWEHQIIALIAAGCKHAEIAERMGSSYKAIQGCHARIRHEMRLESRVDFVRYAAREGLLDLPA
jgi:DNA-binding NarL/FixJ family response regulator